MRKCLEPIGRRGAPTCCEGTASKRRPSGPRETPGGTFDRSDFGTYCRIIAATKPCAWGILSLKTPMPHAPFLWPAYLAPPPTFSSPQSFQAE
jgi:hypothetical protein